MAVGILFISRTPGYNTDLMGFLFGNILLVPRDELWVMAALDLVLLLAVGLFYRQFLAVAFDQEFARLRGVSVTTFYLLLLCLVALTVVLLIQVVGLILVIALLTLPAAIAGHYVQTLGKMMLLASLLGAAFTSTGLALAFGPDLPVGPTIILIAGAVYIVSSILTQVRQRRRAWEAVGVGEKEVD
jgi:zinc transport system permease protein